VQLTVVVPSANVEPEAGVHTGVTAPSTRSMADDAYVTTAPLALVAVAAIVAGTASVGGVVSTTVTAKLPLAVLPWVSELVQLTLVVPSANVLPEGGLHVTGRVPSTRSVAPAANVTAAPLGPAASAVMLGGRVSVGGVVSTIVTGKLALDALPRVSELVHVTIVAPTGKVLPEGGLHVTGRLPST
jgi:hypothetical protein